METHLITITYHECAVSYGLNEAVVREFAELGLVRLAAAPDTIEEEPEHLARLARLHHDLGLGTESIDVVLLLRQRVLQLQRELRRQQARAAQLERFLQGGAPTFDVL
ncbi:hypothetical protein FY528_10745 [Hymenobacter lutimineralis]|uniref:MerR family transcriptional regulator n=1 Tax=Hymenobacter lutimineralis TaxID=2606448 RepID=A0A5D6V1R2_9BACT|nr:MULTISPECIES: chaperone modulator CbpM [Hymenobacter]QIX61675.1 hypothetical protein HER32_10995 [Hymenobacter sp. BT18]TYZ09217.1 hypothetical protein FY528_10745 [Hymenobacter lutimineralis]